ncbi:MAG: zinc finger Ran-binding domain-containing protein [Gemmatimonadaceae bacterium]
MTESGHMDALTALLEERKQYETWIAQLDARRGSAPGHVLERVRGDYAARLGQVTEQLVQRAPELRSSAHELAVRLAGLERDEGEKRDERAEYELRAGVGEYAPEVAQSSFARCDEAIARLASERHAIEAELNRMRGVLAAIDVAAAALGAAPAPSAAPVAEPPRERPAMDELAFLKSLGPDPRLTPALATPHIPAPAPAPAVDEAAPNEDLTQGVSPAFGAARRPTMAEERRSAAGIATSTLTPGAIPQILKDMPTEQVKTLRCQECGTMNYPTEWYCERCGGELAAM